MATFLKAALGVWIAAVIVLAWTWLPPARAFQAGQIVIFHLPNSVVVMLAVLVSAFFGWRYLSRGNDLLDDARSKVAAALAALFCVLTTVTGSIFARVEWGAYWNWDPRQTTVFLLLLVYCAYFLLRAAIDDPARRASAAAVYVVFAAFMTPMLGYVIPKYMMSLHPTNTQFDSAYSAMLWAAIAGFVGLYIWMQNIAVRYERVRLTVENEEEAF